MLRISDIANHVGVSVTTVSYVLNDGPGAERISEKTRDKVLKAAEELGYRSNHFARAMRTGETRMLGVLGGKIESQHVGQMLEGALEAADARGYTLKLLRLHAIGNTAQQAIRRSSEWRLTGILALHLPESTLEELHAEAEKCGTPLVVMDTYCEIPGVHQVVSDDEHGFALGVEHLVKLGHSKIALLKGGGDTTIGISRKKAFELALSHHGLKWDESFCGEGSFHHMPQSVEAARELLNRPLAKRPTAILCANDFMALAVLRVARELKIKVPAELSIIGFSNLKATEYTSPAITTIEQSFPDMGRNAVNMLLGLAGERLQPSAAEPPVFPYAHGLRRQVQVMPTRLVERESTAPAPKCSASG